MFSLRSFSGYLRNRVFWLIAPYAAWMVLMAALPMFPVSPAAAYAVRTAVAGVLIAAAFFVFPRRRFAHGLLSGGSMAWGIAAGVAVFAVWISPETLFGIKGPESGQVSPYSPEVCGWTLTLIKLFGSSVVIAAAEELFFRKWLMDFAGFWWMVALFAIEHDRWAVGAVAGAVYGVLAVKKGLAPAIFAHMTTNFVLGLYVVLGGQWQYW